MRLKHPDLFIVLIITLLTLIISISGIRSGNIEYETLPLWAAPLGILMVLFVPGYVVVAAMLPKVGSEKTLLLSLGLSVSISVVGGLVLNTMPWGLTLVTESLWLSTISFVGILFAWRWRRTHVHEFETGLPSLQKENVAIFGVAGLILLGSVSVAYISSEQKETTFTQLWALPTVTADGKFEIQIGIRNEEKQFENFNLYIDIDGKRLEEWPTIPLEARGEWVTNVELSHIPDRPIQISLYRVKDLKNVYRWLRISPEAFK